MSAHQRGAVRKRMLRRLAQHAADRGIRIETAAGLEEWRGVLRRPADAVALVSDYCTGQGLAWLNAADLQDLQVLLGKGVAA